MILLFVIGASISCGEAPQVFQGIVVKYDASSKMLVARNEKPQNNELIFSLRDGDIGAEPAVGDSVRISYRDRNGDLVAIRLMNLSQQTELKNK